MTSAKTPGGVCCLALSVDIGAGHRRAAEALCEAILTIRPGSQYQIIEALDYLGPGAGKLAKDLYFGVLRDVPDLWGMLYKQRTLIDIFRPVSEFFDDLRIHGLTPVIKSFHPDVIFAMHPIACGLAGALSRSGAVNCPVVAVLTDFDGHPAWIAKGIDLYLAPIPQAARDLERHGLPTGKVVVTGLPLRSAFENICHEKTACSSIGLNSGLFTILLLGGGLGLGPILETAEALTTLEGPIQLVLIAGNNRELEDSARALANRSTVSLHVKGLVENIWDYMSAADLVISKPGGLSCAELLAVGAPFIALAPIPGQEQANCDALVKEGAAIHAPSAQAAYTVVTQLLMSPQLRQEMSLAALRLGRPTATRKAAQLVLSLIEAWPGRE
jgi:processive 1,2-diacylglycerol beta-glucosyltransferase